MSFTLSAGERSFAKGPPSTGSSPKWRALSLSMPARWSGVGCGYWACAKHATNEKDASRIGTIVIFHFLTQRRGKRVGYANMACFRRLLSMPRLLCHFHGVDLLRTRHIRAKDNPLAIGSKVHIWLQRVIVLRHVHQLLRLECSCFNQVFFLHPRVWDRFWMKQIDPLPVRSVRHHLTVSTVACKKSPVRRDVEVHGPLIALQVPPCTVSVIDVISAHPEVFSTRRLQVIPDGLAVR